MLKTLSALSIGTLSIATALLAANVWDKPYTMWTEEDRQKVAEDSPWGDSRDRETGEVNTQNAHVTAKAVRMMWESSLPIKQMLMGKAAADPQVKARMEREEPFHILHIEKLPGSLKEAVAEKEKLIAATTLKVKGKADIHPVDIQQPAPPAPPKGGGGPKGGEGFGSLDAGGKAPTPGGGKGPAPGPGGFGGFGGSPTIQIYFVFAKDAPITLEDKEFEFVTKIGKMEIKRKYNLKSMVYNGKLEW